jgi:hypothetical protein
MYIWVLAEVSSGFTNETLYAFISCILQALSVSSLLTWSFLIMLWGTVQVMKLLIIQIFHPHIISSILVPNVFLSTLFSNMQSMFFPWCQTSAQPHFTPHYVCSLASITMINLRLTRGDKSAGGGHLMCHCRQPILRHPYADCPRKVCGTWYMRHNSVCEMSALSLITSYPNFLLLYAYSTCYWSVVHFNMFLVSVKTSYIPIHIREKSRSNFVLNTNSSRRRGFLQFSSVPSDKCQDNTWNWAVTFSFHSISSSLIIKHPIICCCIFWDCH